MTLIGEIARYGDLVVRITNNAERPYSVASVAKPWKVLRRFTQSSEAREWAKDRSQKGE